MACLEGGMPCDPWAEEACISLKALPNTDITFTVLDTKGTANHRCSP